MQGSGSLGPNSHIDGISLEKNQEAMLQSFVEIFVWGVLAAARFYLGAFQWCREVAKVIYASRCLSGPAFAYIYVSHAVMPGDRNGNKDQNCWFHEALPKHVILGRDTLIQLGFAFGFYHFQAPQKHAYLQQSISLQ